MSTPANMRWAALGWRPLSFGRRSERAPSGFQLMNEHPTSGISGVDPLRAIDLIWTLRDIKAKRTLLPPDPGHLRELIELGLVEMRDDVPAITNEGHSGLD